MTATAYGQAVNSASPQAAQAVSAAISGGDPVAAAVGAQINPVAGYVQAGAAALTALNGLSANGQIGAPNVSTPNFNNAPTAIVNFGPGNISASANPTNTQSATTPSSAGSAVSGIFSGVSSYVVLAVGAVLALVIIKKAKA